MMSGGASKITEVTLTGGGGGEIPEYLSHGPLFIHNFNNLY
jgi:hypothetical protein